MGRRAKVVNVEGKFDDTELIVTQMEGAIRRLHGEFGCRVINISLADKSRLAGAKRTPWAAILDDLARELDLVIVVSAGNTDHGLLHQLGDRVVAEYPAFLFDYLNRIFEPATAINVLTVGSIAGGNGLEEGDDEFVAVQPITRADEPSPFTRIGTGDPIKPELVDYGGTAIFDGAVQRVLDGSQRSAAGILTLNSAYLERLLTTRSGTSFASPRVAYKAASIRGAFPNASANLTRVLMALCAEVPQAALDCLAGYNDQQISKVLGYGLPDIEAALSSEDNRMILFTEDTLPVDRFAVYEVPIPDVFQVTKGKRQIKVALAFDPPVRHTRLDYAGITMGFRLIRGASQDEVFDAFRKWEKAEGQPYTLPNKLKCTITPGPQLRERGTLQCGSFKAQRNIEAYGDRYFLAVRCQSGWAADVVRNQRFAIAVEVRHEAALELYNRMRVRLRA